MHVDPIGILRTTNTELDVYIGIHARIHILHNTYTLVAVYERAEGVPKKCVPMARGFLAGNTPDANSNARILKKALLMEK